MSVLRTTALRALAIASAGALLASCGGELTEILVVVDSDLPVPSALDGVRVEVSGAETMTAEGSLRSGGALPRTVGVVHRGGSLGPVEIRAVGTLGGAEVVSALARTSFLRGRTLVLPLFLSRACRGVSCGDGETCLAGRCASAEVDPQSLAEWNGSVGRIDGGTACEPATERCNSVDDDCDGAVDEGFDLETDVLHCGACFHTCSTHHATPACMGGTCTIASCEDGFGDCDGDAANGCEADFASSIFHCGGCGRPCELANAEAACSSGTCAVAACAPGFGDCNDDASDGCEAALDTAANCGACGVSCLFEGGSGTCVDGECVLDTCAPGFADCNADASDGCETPLNTPSDCGACGRTCSLPNATATCTAGSCAIESCDAGFGDCNADASDGCETPLNTLS
ncbi:MAG TPA: hypothetical protein VIL20_24600, partial [Sandaracinaceae bacterium]